MLQSPTSVRVIMEELEVVLEKEKRLEKEKLQSPTSARVRMLLEMEEMKRLRIPRAKMERKPMVEKVAKLGKGERVESVMMGPNLHVLMDLPLSKMETRPHPSVLMVRKQQLAPMTLL